MNYYEQFYDDLEFCEEDDPYRRNGRYDHNSGHDRDFDNYEEEWTHRDQAYQTMDRGRGHHLGERGRPTPYNRRERERGGEQYLDRGRENIYRGRDNVDRGRGSMNRGRGIIDRGRGNVNRGQGNFGRGGQRGKFEGFVNFVKAGTESDENTTGVNTNVSQHGTQDSPQTTGAMSDTIRFDYKKYQNQPSSTEQEVATAMNVYTHPVLSSYGYGTESDFQEFGAKSLNDDTVVPYMEDLWKDAAMSMHPTDVQGHMQQQEHQHLKQPSPLVKKAMVKPAFNFVRAGSEFKSTDVAFHETQTSVEKAQSSFVVGKAGNKRAGLGMQSVVKGDEFIESDDISAMFYAGMKDGCNPQFDKRFNSLQEAVRARNAPGKNGIEVLHMAVDKVKMKIMDDVRERGRTQSGQAMFVCRLIVDGVFIAEGTALAKKAAKHEAYTNAMNVFSNSALTVKEVSKGVFELKPKDVQLGLPLSVPNKHTSQTKQKYTPSQGHQTTWSNQNSLSSTGNVSYPTSHINMAAYTKPKIIFHKSSHLADQPLDFKKPNSGASAGPSNMTSQTKSAGHQPNIGATSNPTALANKLLAFVKEGTSVEDAPNKKSPSNMTPNQSHANAKSNSYQTPKPFTQASQTGSKRPLFQLPEESSFKMTKTNQGNKRLRATLDDLSQFIILDYSIVHPNNTDMTILHCSANFNKVVMKLEYEMTTDGYNCSVIISDHVVFDEQGSTKEEAKLAAAKHALNYLREVCYTILIKQDVDAESGGLSKEDLLGEIQKGGDVIPNSNIGNMLLRKMGWAGGGVGKDGKGIAEPIRAEQVIGREGLGLKAEKEKNLGKGFHEKVQKILTDYIKSNDQKDLHFSSELAKEERAIIHKMGQKLGLKTQSRGKDNDRYLIISRKRSAFQLLEHVIGSGGATSKYEVVPPTNTDSDPRRRDAMSYGHCKQ